MKEYFFVAPFDAANRPKALGEQCVWGSTF